LRIHYKSIRDSTMRGQSLDDVSRTIQSRMVDAEKFIHPQRFNADLSFHVGCESGQPSVPTTLTCTIGDPVLLNRIEKELGSLYSVEFTQVDNVFTFRGELDWVTGLSKFPENALKSPRQMFPYGLDLSGNQFGLMAAIIIISLDERRGFNVEK